MQTRGQCAKETAPCHTGGHGAVSPPHTGSWLGAWLLNTAPAASLWRDSALRGRQLPVQVASVRQDQGVSQMTIGWVARDDAAHKCFGGRTSLNFCCSDSQQPLLVPALARARRYTPAYKTRKHNTGLARAGQDHEDAADEPPLLPGGKRWPALRAIQADLELT